jgi:hypothetical protein
LTTIIYHVPPPGDLATLAANTGPDGVLLTIHLAANPEVQVAEQYAVPGEGEDEYLDWADFALDIAGYVMTGYRATGENRWVLEGAPMLRLHDGSAVAA